MKRNFYEILEVDKNASQEIIDKAYKTLAKKYHPDLRDNVEKKYAEEAFKQINEAYETLSDPEKRATYNNSLKFFNISTSDIELLYNQNKELKEQLKNIMDKYSQIQNNSNFNSNYHSENLYANNNEHINKSYYSQTNIKNNDNYYNSKYNNYHSYDVNNNTSFFKNFKLNNLKFLNQKIKSLLSIIFVCFILYILWHLPIVNKFFDYLYNNNFIIHYIIDFISTIFNINN